MFQWAMIGMAMTMVAWFIEKEVSANTDTPVSYKVVATNALPEEFPDPSNGQGKHLAVVAEKLSTARQLAEEGDWGGVWDVLNTISNFAFDNGVDLSMSEDFFDLRYKSYYRLALMELYSMLDAYLGNNSDVFEGASKQLDEYSVQVEMEIKHWLDEQSDAVSPSSKDLGVEAEGECISF